jgi:sugar/nucleoside kinase (ribokinase family)
MIRTTDADVDVVAIGSAIVDVLAHASDAFLEEHGLVKGTMALIDAEAAERLYAQMGPGVEVSGGAVANTAAGVASFGSVAAFVGRVRDDQLGSVFAHDIRAAGVVYDVPAAAAGPATARCLVLVTPDAQRTMCTFLGAAVGLGAGDVDESLVRRSAVLFLEGYLWDPPEAIEALRLGVRAARDAGRRVAFTLSDPFCVDRHRDEFLELIEQSVDVLFANEEEAKALFKTSSLDDAVSELRARCDVVAVTRGALGSVVVSGDLTVVVPASGVGGAGVVDTTGAGDLYAAGFLVGLVRGAGLERCGLLGSLAAAEVISHVGARPEVSLARLAEEAGLLP